MARLFRDTTPEAEAVLIELLRKKTPAEKLRMVCQLNASVKAFAKAGLRSRNPGASEEEIDYLYSELVLGPELAKRVAQARKSRNE